jgi:hypothetical protein
MSTERVQYSEKSTSTNDLATNDTKGDLSNNSDLSSNLAVEFEPRNYLDTAHTKMKFHRSANHPEVVRPEDFLDLGDKKRAVRFESVTGGETALFERETCCGPLLPNIGYVGFKFLDRKIQQII